MGLVRSCRSAAPTPWPPASPLPAARLGRIGIEYRLTGGQLRGTVEVACRTETTLTLTTLLWAAPNSSPEGGFWLYHFDDGADVPKVGYARLFTGNIPLPGGGTRPIRFIIRSGFYRSSESVFVRRILETLEDGETSIIFGLSTPEEGDVVSVSVAGTPTDTVHFAYRLAGFPEQGFTYLGAATNREELATFTRDPLPDDDYELFAFMAEDDGYSVTYDVIEVNVDNVGDSGCAAAPLLPGGPADATIAILVGLPTVHLLFRRRLEPQARLG